MNQCWSFILVFVLVSGAAAYSDGIGNDAFRIFIDKHLKQFEKIKSIDYEIEYKPTNYPVTDDPEEAEKIALKKLRRNADRNDPKLQKLLRSNTAAFLYGSLKEQDAWAKRYKIVDDQFIIITSIIDDNDIINVYCVLHDCFAQYQPTSKSYNPNQAQITFIQSERKPRSITPLFLIEDIIKRTDQYKFTYYQLKENELIVKAKPVAKGNSTEYILTIDIPNNRVNALIRIFHYPRENKLREKIRYDHFKYENYGDFFEYPTYYETTSYRYDPDGINDSISASPTYLKIYSINKMDESSMNFEIPKGVIIQDQINLTLGEKISIQEKNECLFDLVKRLRNSKN